MITRRCAYYMRVSTAAKSKQGEAVSFVQNPEVQEQPLRDLVDQGGWIVHRVYSDRASGARNDARLDAVIGRRAARSVPTWSSSGGLTDLLRRQTTDSGPGGVQGDWG